MYNYLIFLTKTANFIIYQYFLTVKIRLMKSKILVAAMTVLFFIGLTSMINMSSEPYPYCKEDCDFLVGAGLFQSNGACISACHVCTNHGKGATSAVCICKIIDAETGLNNLGLNFGQCVNILKEN